MSVLKTQVSHQEGIWVIQLAGYLSSEAAGPVETAFQQVADAPKVLLVFQEKDFITSAGLAVVFLRATPAGPGATGAQRAAIETLPQGIRHRGLEQGRGGVRRKGAGAGRVEVVDVVLVDYPHSVLS